MHESEDGGASWRDAGLPATDVFSVAYSPADGAAYAGCEPSALFVRRNGEWEELSAFRELPSAPTWSFSSRPWTSHVRWIAPSPHDASLIHAGIELGGVKRTVRRRVACQCLAPYGQVAPAHCRSAASCELSGPNGGSLPEFPSRYRFVSIRGSFVRS